VNISVGLEKYLAPSLNTLVINSMVSMEMLVRRTVEKAEITTHWQANWR
jgi:hypothetical protein